MATSCRVIDDRSLWNSVLQSLPAGHVLQSWEWGEVKREHGWMPVRLLWEREGIPVAAAQVLRRPLPRTPWGIMYVPKGPALDYEDSQLLRRVLATLEDFARRQKGVFIKVDPDADGEGVVAILQERGWQYSAEQIQFRNTALLDLTLAEEELLARMKSKTRYNIRLASRRGVTVREGALRDLGLFYEMYAETGRRDGFLVRPYRYYCLTWQRFLQAGMATMLLAEVGGEVVAGVILFHFGRRGWYMYGASTGRHRNLMPNYALQWAAIRHLKEMGCTIYDLWGAPDVLDESDSMWGVWRFKRGLGAVFTPHIGAYDFAPSRPLYVLYCFFQPLHISLLHRLHRIRTAEFLRNLHGKGA